LVHLGSGGGRIEGGQGDWPGTTIRFKGWSFECVRLTLRVRWWRSEEKVGGGKEEEALREEEEEEEEEKLEKPLTFW